MVRYGQEDSGIIGCGHNHWDTFPDTDVVFDTQVRLRYMLWKKKKLKSHITNINGQELTGFHRESS